LSSSARPCGSPGRCSLAAMPMPPMIAKTAQARRIAVPKRDKEQDALEEKEAVVPLVGGSDGMIEDIGSDPAAVDAESLVGEAASTTLRALATWPCEFTATLSENFEAGATFTIQGPLGPIKVQPPTDAKPGMSLRYRLAPKPDLRVQVPPGGKPGSVVTFQRASGIHTIVKVPDGHWAGDLFDVVPPALMVLVPQGAQKGDFVTFHTPAISNQPVEWFRAQVPAGVPPGKFLTARLPMPKPQKPSALDPNQSLAAFWHAFSYSAGGEGLATVWDALTSGGGGPLHLPGLACDSSSLRLPQAGA